MTRVFAFVVHDYMTLGVLLSDCHSFRLLAILLCHSWGNGNNTGQVPSTMNAHLSATLFESTDPKDWDTWIDELG
jgi:hypothetical protein